MATIKGGDKFKQHLDGIAARIANASAVDIGWPSGDNYPDGKPVAMIAAIQEFGAPKAGIPPRPYFRTMISKESPSWPKQTAQLLKNYDGDAAKSLGAMGADIAAELQYSIIDTNAPALSPVTLMLRMMRREDPDLVVTGKTVGIAAARVAAGEKAEGVSEKPLVDSGYMLQSVKFIVR